MLFKLNMYLYLKVIYLINKVVVAYSNMPASLTKTVFPFLHCTALYCKLILVQINFVVSV